MSVRRKVLLFNTLNSHCYLLVWLWNIILFANQNWVSYILGASSSCCCCWCFFHIFTPHCRPAISTIHVVSAMITVSWGFLSNLTHPITSTSTNVSTTHCLSSLSPFCSPTTTREKNCTSFFLDSLFETVYMYVIDVFLFNKIHSLGFVAKCNKKENEFWNDIFWNSIHLFSYSERVISLWQKVPLTT